MTLFGGWDGATNIFNSVLKLTPDGVAGEGVVCCWVPPPPLLLDLFGFAMLFSLWFCVFGAQGPSQSGSLKKLWPAKSPLSPASRRPCAQVTRK